MPVPDRPTACAPAQVASPGDERLQEEAISLARYLVGEAPDPAVLDRYVAAHRIHFPGDAAPADRAVLHFCRRHAWAIPLLDAGAGVLAPRSLLRGKILLMVALLETTTRFAGHFLPAPASRAALLAAVAGIGGLAAIKALLGVPLWILVRAWPTPPTS